MFLRHFYSLIFYMRIQIILILGTILLSSCFKHENNKSEMSYIATINGEPISSNIIDSIVKTKIYLIKREALQTYISGKIIEMEAKANSMTVDEYVKKEIFFKVTNVSDEELTDFINKITNNKFFSQDNEYRAKAFNALLYSKRKSRQNEITDSLISKKYNVDILLHSPFTQVNLRKLKTHSLGNEKSKVQVYIITEFDCGACKEKFKEIEQLYSKFKSTVKFNFVNYAHDVSFLQIACEAAAKQGKYKELYDEIFQQNNDNFVIDHLAERIDLNLSQFNKDMKDTSLYNLVKNNNEIIHKNSGLYTPAIIIDDLLMPSECNIYEIEMYILDFLK